jgi:Asp-tRNA(Asn)/Glu-tRNA(Gln) amidotransferase A subunit family amidase
MPILLKDNINFEGYQPRRNWTKNNDAADAFIVKRIKGKGGIIGKLI